MMKKAISLITLSALLTLSQAQAETKATEQQSIEKNEPKLFQAFDQKALEAKPKEKTAEGHTNIVPKLDEHLGKSKGEAKKRSSSSAAVKKSRAVQRAVSYTVRGKKYQTLADSSGFVQTGRASWYGKRFHGRKTASGEVFNMNALTAAHKELPLGTKIEVTNNDNGKSIVVTVNDRGPFHGNRVLDLSKAAAKKLGVLSKGTADVTIRAL